MIIPIKQIIQEGYSYETILEAVHVNHFNLNKERLKDPKTSHEDRKKIAENRKDLADDIRDARRNRDGFRKSNYPS